jgi:hypothetical protein
MVLGTISVTVGATGQVIIETANGSYNINSFYSYPGAQLSDSTANALAPAGIGGSEPGWSPPQITDVAPTTIEVAAKGASYSLLRHIHLFQNESVYQIDFEDQLENLRPVPTGIFVHYTLTAPEPFADHTRVPEHAENPTMFLDVGVESLGILFQDDVSRVRWIGHYRTAVADFYVGFYWRPPNWPSPDDPFASCIALDVGRIYSIKWRLYIIPGNDYFYFINRVRLDWEVNATIDGPFQFFNLALKQDADLLASPQELAAYLKRKRLCVVCLTPTLDFYTFGSDRTWPFPPPSNFPNVLTRSGYTLLMSAAVLNLKKAEPKIKCLGMVETGLVVIDPNILAQDINFSSCSWTYCDYQALINMILDPNRNPRVILPSVQPIYTLPPETQAIEQAKLPWIDSVWRQNGSFQLYLYNSSAPLLLSVYPGQVNGAFNYQHEFLLDNQIKFLLDVVRFDGFYIDGFSQSWNSGTPSFHTFTGWDRLSADLDVTTSDIVKPDPPLYIDNGLYVDMGLAGRASRREICEFALNNGKTVVANSYPTSAAEQPLPVNRFMETSSYFTGDSWYVPLGQPPEWMVDFLISSLATPIGLGLAADSSDPHPPAVRLMNGVMRLLRHGMVYYYYLTNADIPLGVGEYGPINHMFPLTPVALHAGWIEGKERIITVIGSQKYVSFPPAPNVRPVVYCFDIWGHPISVPVIISQFPVPSTQGPAWEVEVKIEDWAQFAIIAYDS